MAEDSQDGLVGIILEQIRGNELRWTYKGGITGQNQEYHDKDHQVRLLERDHRLVYQ